MAGAFDELRRVDDPAGRGWESTRYANSADTLAHVLELVSGRLAGWMGGEALGHLDCLAGWSWALHTLLSFLPPP
jgi:hypothetical protein